MAVWYLASQEVLRSIVNLFGMQSRSTAHGCIMEVCHFLAGPLKNKYAKWPISEEQEVIANAFAEVAGFPDVTGALDGTHIPVKPPVNNRDSYINRKGFPSINVLAVCDNKMMFLDVSADRAGSVHDARVLRVRNLRRKLEKSILTRANHHILADSVYPLLPQLLKTQLHSYLSAGNICTQTIYTTVQLC